MLRRFVFVLCLLASACTTARPISPPGMNAFELSLATSGVDMMIAWHGGPSGHDAIYLQSADAIGHAVGGAHRVTDGQRYAYEPDLQLIGRDALLAWYEKDSVTGELTAWLARLNRDGQPIWRNRLDASGGYARNPVVRLAGDMLVAAWIETATGEPPAVWTARFNADGVLQGQPRRAGAASSTTWNLNATTDAAGTFYVAYDARLDTQASELRLLAITADAVQDLTLSADDGFASVYPDIGISETGDAALTWFDAKDDNEEIYLAIMPLKDLLAGKPLPAARITRTSTSSTGAYLAWNDGRLALLWCDTLEGQQELYRQTFVDGLPATPIQRLTHTSTHSSIPSIRLYREGFVIAWNEYAAEGEGLHRSIRTSDAMIIVLDK